MGVRVNPEGTGMGRGMPQTPRAGAAGLRESPTTEGPAAALLIGDCIAHWSAVIGERPAHTFMDYSADPGGRARTLTYRELDRLSRAVAEQVMGETTSGDRVAILAPQGTEYVVAMLGVLRSEAIAVPLFAPDLYGHGERLASVLDDCAPRCVLTTRDKLESVRALLAEDAHPSVQTVLCVDDLIGEQAAAHARAYVAPDGVRPEDCAYLQYTSGSTGSPSGVVLTHANLLANTRQLREGHDARHNRETLVSWLPLFHDMGLLLGALVPAAEAFHGVVFDPLAFIARPQRWLELLTAHDHVVSGGPNFAFDYCVKRIGADDRAGLDLSRVHGLLNGAEPVQAATLERFVDAFAPCGLRREMLRPSYGLAEATVCVSVSRAHTAPAVLEADPAALQGGAYAHAAADAPRAQRLVSSGFGAGQHVAIAEPATGERLPERRVGEIWVHGPNVGTGYWGQPQRSAEVFGARLGRAGDLPEGPWLRTGDLGFLLDGQLYVTGRIKDLIIVDGRNIYPHDVEATVESAHPAIAQRRLAAFAVDAPDGAGERIVVVAERYRRADDVAVELADIQRAARRAVSAEHGVELHDFVLVEPDTVARTSSGKIARAATRRAYLDGALAAVPGGEPSRASLAEDPSRETAGAAGGGRERIALRNWIRSELAGMLGVDVDEVDPARPITDLGLASRQAVELVGALERHLHRALDATLIFETPTIDQLVERLVAAEPSLALPRPLEAPASAAVEADAAPAGADAIAVIGVGCRLPGGVEGPAAFWQMLLAGRDVVSEVPADRWGQFTPAGRPSARVVEAVNRRGGFLVDVAGFDAEFFGISPREAELMDPQQRILLEVAWEAIEHAGIDPDALRGTETGVFVGMCNSEYAQLTMADLARVEAWTSTGSALSIAANRLSYLLDLQGPSMTLDTACSSSLVAVHQAVRSLLAGETSAALVGGVNLLLAPGVTVNFDRAGALAPDGRCKPFSDDADGIARSEGCGVVVLKRLADARRDGDRVLAVIRASGVNSDGRSNGLMAPNPRAQRALLRDVYERSGLDARDVDYVEAHGTGTLLGDPIEASALAEVLGAGRTNGPLLIGSVKSNLGHTEGAAGVVGLIKVVLALHHDCIPASLHFRAPNPHIEFAEGQLEVVTEPRRWPRRGGVARAGVSAFGFGGTNCHVVLEEACECPALDPGLGADRPTTLLLSAPTEQRLRADAERLVAWLDAPGVAVALTDVAHTLARRRRRGPLTASVTGRGRLGAVEGLRRLARGDDGLGIVAPTPLLHADGRAGGAVWVFSGHGSQWAGMGRRLLAEEPAFAVAVDALADAFVAEVGYSLREALAAEGDGRDLAHAQMALFGTQLALAELWRTRGLRPAAVVGHSVGEVAAATVAGALDVGQGLRVMAARASALSRVNAGGDGAMAVVECSASELAGLAARFPDVGVAVYASPRQLTVTGDDAQVRALAAHFEQQGRGAWVLNVTGAGHSPAVDPHLERFASDLGVIDAGPCRVPLYSTVLADPRAPGMLDAYYWTMNLRRPVRFSQAIEAAAADGLRAFVEISPHPVAETSIRHSLAAASVNDAVIAGTLRRGDDEVVSFHSNVARLAAAGLLTELDGLVAPARNVDLPPMRWERRRFWMEAAPPRARGGEDDHPLLGAYIDDPDPARHLWHGELRADAVAWLGDHQLYGTTVLPAAAYAEMALSAAGAVLGGHSANLILSGLELEDALVVRDVTVLTTALTLTGDGAARIEFYAREAARQGPGGRPGQALTRHATATVRVGAALALVEPVAPVGRLEPVDVYAGFARAGHRYGPAFTGVTNAGVDDAGVATADVELASCVDDVAEYRLHPALLDLCLQTLAAAAARVLPQDCLEHLYLPVAIGQLVVHGAPGRRGRVVASLRVLDGDARGLEGTLRLVGDDGEPLLEAREVYLRRFERHAVALPLMDKLYEAVWQPAPLESTQPHGGHWLLVTDAHGEDGTLSVEAVRRALYATGSTVSVCVGADEEAIAAALGQVPPGKLAGAVLIASASGSDGEPGSPERGRELTGLALRATRALLRADGHGGARLSIVTRGAVAVHESEGGEPAGASLRALGRVLSIEHGGVVARALDLDPAGTDSEALSCLLAELRSDDVDEEVAWRRGQRYVRRLMRVRELAAADGEPVVRAGAYAITGGLGGLGLEVARWLSACGASRIALLGRSDPSDDARAVIAALERDGTEVLVLRGDVSDPGVGDRLIALATADGVPLRGVVHAAGVLEDAMAEDVTEDALRRVWAPKADGAWALHRATRHCELDFWVAFSSAAALFGSPGQSAYATANAWLDGLVAWRRAHGLPGATINWGVWAEVGAARDIANPLLDPLRPREGIDALEAVLTSGRQSTAVVRLDIERAVALLPRLRDVPPLRALLAEAAPRSEVAGTARAAIDAVKVADPDRARELVAEFLCKHVAAVTGHRAADIDQRAPLTSLGLDSLMAVRARNLVEHDFGLDLPVRTLLQGASLADVGERFAAELGIGARAPAPAEPGAPVHPGRRYVEPRDASERWLAAVWSDILRRKVGATDRFDDVGGDAAAEEAVLARLADRLGRRLDRDLLFAEPTVERQADLLRESLESNAGAPVRVLRRGGQRHPLFLFHPAGGPTSVYEPLVEQLGDSQPVYGFERIDGLHRIEDKAARYIEMMREIAPRGPYRVGGWSLGGVLAYEVARQLRRLDEPVGLVAMIDSVLPAPSPGLSEQAILAERLSRFVDYLRDTYEIALDIDVPALAALDDDAQIDAVMSKISDAGLMSPGLLEHQRTSYVDARIAERYKPGPYDGAVVLYRATDRGLTTTLDPRYHRTEPDLGWAAHCRSLEVVQVRGDHTSIIDPPAVGVIGEHLGLCLEGRRPIEPVADEQVAL